MTVILQLFFEAILGLLRGVLILTSEQLTGVLTLTSRGLFLQLFLDQNFDPKFLTAEFICDPGFFKGTKFNPEK